MTERVLVTAALPYANGSLHLGHLVEYCQADMYVRALKFLGIDALYICANDAHGTPIEINARKQNITPEALVQRFHQEHQRDFARFDVCFDHFSTTHTQTNQGLVNDFYARLCALNQIEEREVDGNFCETDQRFLPDRFIKGDCPKCGTKDQYGDVCESCSATYSPTELRNARCVLCGSTPIVKPSRHVFFKLSDQQHADFLRAWIDSGALQTDVANYVRNWINTGLRDWCISRDGPYFGFAVPNLENKFFYVWLDAPIGYIATSSEWASKHNVSLAQLWQSPNTRIEHIIGKDIVYFHTLFWPAVLNQVGYTLPSRVHVHGMLTINGEKMSKSRGTFITAATFAEHVDPQALRYYYACKYSSQSDDLDLSLDDFVQRVNSELVNKHANLFSRVTQFVHQKLDHKIGALPFSAQDAQLAGDSDNHLLHLARLVVAAAKRCETHYKDREFSHAVREICIIADIGNEFMQNQKPWDQLKSDPEQARLTCTFVSNVCHALAMYLWPIVPRFAEQAARMLGVTLTRMGAHDLFSLNNVTLNPTERLFDRLDRAHVERIVGASKPAEVAAPAVQEKPSKPLVSFDDFAKLDLRVGLVVSAEAVPKSRKLLRLMVDVGEAKPRQVITGLALAYPPEQLLGTKLVLIVNLAPAKIMGYESFGMILSAEGGDKLAVLRSDQEMVAGSSIK